jgi:hypothetical protein
VNARFFAFSLALLLGAGATAKAQPTFSIAGTVTYAENGAPLPHARVYLLRAAHIVASMITAGDGKFSFDLPQGTYNLWAGPRMLPQIYGHRTALDHIGSSIITGPDQDTSHLTFRWFARGAISGKVVDSDGEPVADALVQLIRSAVTTGRRLNTTLGWSRTNDLGEYRFGQIYAGTYFVVVTAQPWYAKGRVSVPPGQGSPIVAFAPTYYPNTTEIGRAAPLILNPSDEARADFTLTPVPGATVVVTHDAPRELRGTVGLVRDGIAGRESFQEQEAFIGARKAYTLFGVPPGHYTLRIAPSAGGPQLACDQSVDVNGSDVRLDVKLLPPPQVSGTVQFPATEGRPRGTMLAQLMREDGTGTSSATVKPDGSFTFSSLLATRYQPAISLSGVGGYFASEIRVDGAPFRDGVIDLSNGLDVTLRMTASHEMGRLNGFAMQDGKPVEGVMVVLAPAAESNDPTVYRAFQTDSDGSYDWKYVRAGTYILFATTDTQIEYKRFAAIKPYVAKAKPIRIESHAVYTENVHVIEVAVGK